MNYLICVRAIFNCQTLLRINFNCIIFSWTASPIHLNSHLKCVTSGVCIWTCCRCNWTPNRRRCVFHNYEWSGKLILIILISQPWRSSIQWQIYQWHGIGASRSIFSFIIWSATCWNHFWRISINWKINISTLCRHCYWVYMLLFISIYYIVSIIRVSFAGPIMSNVNIFHALAINKFCHRNNKNSLCVRSSWIYTIWDLWFCIWCPFSIIFVPVTTVVSRTPRVSC